MLSQPHGSLLQLGLFIAIPGEEPRHIETQLEV